MSATRHLNKTSHGTVFGHPTKPFPSKTRMPRTLTNQAWLTLSTLISLISLFTLFGCTKPQPTLTEQTFYTFGTEITIQIYHHHPEQAQQAISEIEQTFYQFHQFWHAWQPDSMLSAINRAIAHSQPIALDTSSREFILKSQHLSAQTDHLFDPAIGGLIRLWGFQGQTDWQPPSEAARQSWLDSRPSIADLAFINDTLISHNSDVRLDFGGNAKGLALDLTTPILQHHQIQNAIINIGGDLKVLGQKPNKQAWSIGIQNPTNPKDPQHALATIKPQDGDHIFTSGTYQRYFEWQGQRYSHILDPNTAWPAVSFASVTVIHHDAVTADTAATALLIAGPDRWQRIAKQLGVDKVMTVDQKGRIYVTPAMQDQTQQHNP